MGTNHVKRMVNGAVVGAELPECIGSGAGGKGPDQGRKRQREPGAYNT